MANEPESGDGQSATTEAAAPPVEKRETRKVCSGVTDAVEAARTIGYPVVLTIMHAIDLGEADGKPRRKAKPHSRTLDDCRFAANSKEVREVATVMIANFISRRNAKAQKLLREQERALFHLNKKIEEFSASTSLRRKDDPLVIVTHKRKGAVQEQLKKLKSEHPPNPEIVVCCASRHQSTMLGFEYLGCPNWDPQKVTELMPCDFATTALRAAYTGTLNILQCVGVSNELRQAHADAQDLPHKLDEEISSLRRSIAELEANQSSETQLHAAEARLLDATEEKQAAMRDAERSKAALAALEAKVSTQQSAALEGIPSMRPPELSHAARAELEALLEDDDASGGGAETPKVSAARRRQAAAALARAETDRLDWSLHPGGQAPSAQVNAAAGHHARYTERERARDRQADREHERERRGRERASKRERARWSRVSAREHARVNK